MPSSYTAGNATLDIVPSMKGFHTKLAAELKGTNPSVSIAADTRQYVQQITKVAKKDYTAVIKVKADKSALDKAQADLIASEKKLAAAREVSGDATSRVAIAEKSLKEVRAKSGDDSSKAASAELKFAQARRAAASAVNDVRNAEARLTSSRKNRDDSAFQFFSTNNTSLVTQAIADVTKLGSAAGAAGGAFGGMGGDAAGGLGKIAGGASSALGPIGALVAAGAGLTVIVGAAGFAAASLIGIAQAAITASAAVLLVPAALAVVGAVAATGAIGMMGVTDALDAVGKAHQGAGKNAADNAKQQRTAADAIASAETSVTRARQDAARSQVEAAKRIADAEQAEKVAREDAARAAISSSRAVLAADRDRLRAERDLADAIDNVTKSQRDLNFQVRGGVIDQKEAVLDLAVAAEQLAAAREAGVEGDDLTRLTLAYDRQKLAVESTTASNADLAAQQADAQKTGVKGSRAVLDATQALADAAQGAADARTDQAYQRVQSERQVQAAVDAVHDAEDARTQAAIQAERSISDALKARKAAYESAAESAGTLSAAEQAAKDAMDALSPSARKFVEQVLALTPAWNDVKGAIQEALFNGLDEKIKKLTDVYFPIMRDRLSDIADAGNDAAKEIADLLSDPKNANTVNGILENTATIVDNIAKAVTPIIEAFLDIASVGAEVLADVSGGAEDAAGSFRDWIREMKDSGKLKDWMTGAVEIIGQIIKGAIDFGKAMVTVISELNGGVKDSGFYDQLSTMFKDFIAFVQTEEGKQFFYNLGKTIGDIATKTAQVLQIIGDLLVVYGDIDQFFRDLTGGATGFGEVVARVFLGLGTLGISEIIMGLFDVDWSAIGDTFTGGTNDVMARIVLAMATFGISELIRALFQVDWASIGEWFNTGTGQVLGRVALAISTFGVSELIRLAFNVDWDAIGRFFTDGMGRVWQLLTDFIGRLNPMNLLDKILPSGGGILGDGVRGFLNQAFGGHADGGYITGPGGPRDDIIPALLSNGEFVVNAAATKRNRVALESMNARRYADGGIVGAGTKPNTGGPADAITIDPAGIAGLGDVAATVTAAITTLRDELTALVADVVGYWLTIQQDTLSTADTIAAREFLLQQQITTAWTAIQATVWSSVNSQQGAFGVLMSGLSSVRDAVQQTANWAVSQFARITAAAADPIRWVLQFPFNAGLISAWNSLDSQFALGKHVEPIKLAFATGGKVPGSGNKDTVKARLTPGEYVLSKRAIENMGGLASVDRLHKMARAGIIGPDANLGRTHGDGKRRQDLMRTVPLDGLGFAYGGVQPHVAFAGEEVERTFGKMPGGVGGVGGRPNVSDHPYGLALDFMTLQNSALGDRVAGYLEQNAPRLLVKYLIWKQRIDEGAGFQPMEDRGSITANHFDHVHTSFLRAGQAGKTFTGGEPAFDPSSAVNDAFKASLGMVGEVSGRWPGNYMAAQGAGIAGKGIEAVKAKALAQMLAAMSAGTPNVQYDGDVAKTVMEVGKALGFPRRGAEVALATGLQESHLRNLNYGDRDSLGVFQQRPSQGWGTPAQIMNPVYSATKFYEALRRVSGWENLPHTVAAQRVQQSGFPDAYAKWVPQAIGLVNSSGLFDQGGLAVGAGLLAKNTIEPERVLSPAQTRSFDQALSTIGSGAVASQGGVRDAVVTGKFNLDGVLVDLVDGRIEYYDHQGGDTINQGVMS